MEEAVNPDNCRRALQAVTANRGAPGMDGMRTERLVRRAPGEALAEDSGEAAGGDLCAEPCEAGRDAEAERRYTDAGNTDGAGSVHTALLLQAMSPIWEPRFSEHSYGFRPGRSARDAVRAAQGYAREGRDWVVDLDITRFFDHVNWDILMGKIAQVIRDKRVLKLIGKYLRAGANVQRRGGQERGGNAAGRAALLANIYLDALDRELERRGHRFSRYADDCAPRAQRAEEGPMCVTAESMREGPSEPADRSSSQTTFGGCGQKPWS